MKTKTIAEIKKKFYRLFCERKNIGVERDIQIWKPFPEVQPEEVIEFIEQSIKDALESVRIKPTGHTKQHYNKAVEDQDKKFKEFMEGLGDNHAKEKPKDN